MSNLSTHPASVPPVTNSVIPNNASNCYDLYPASLCNFGIFLLNCFYLVNLITFLPQLYKLYRKRKRQESIASGLSLCWLAIATCSAAANFRFLSTLSSDNNNNNNDDSLKSQTRFNSRFALIMEVWLFLTQAAAFIATLSFAETHFDYQRMLTAGMTMLGCVLVIVLSCISPSAAMFMKGVSNFLAMLQIYPQLLLSELLHTSRAVSVWTIVLLVVKYCEYYVAQYILYWSVEDFVFSYMTSIMFLAALFHCYAYPESSHSPLYSNGISRGHTAGGGGRSSAGGMTSGAGNQQGTIDGFFSIDDFGPIDGSGIDEGPGLSPAYLPTVSARQDNKRATFGCLTWYTTVASIGVVALILTVGLVWKVRQFIAIFAPICVCLLILSVFAFRAVLPERMVTAIRLML